MKRASFLFGLFAVCLLGCGGSTAASSTSSTSSPEAKPSAPIIAALKTHDGKVSIRGGGELRVVVTKDDGTVVADNVSLDELRTKDPESWMLVKSAVAQGDGTYLDATFTAAPAPALK